MQTVEGAIPDEQGREVRERINEQTPWKLLSLWSRHDVDAILEDRGRSEVMSKPVM